MKQIEGLFVQVLQLVPELMRLIRLGHIALGGAKVKANTSKHKTLSWEHVARSEAQLCEEVKNFLVKAAQSDGALLDSMDLPAEIACSDARLKVIDGVKAKIAKRQVLRGAGKTLCGENSELPHYFAGSDMIVRHVMFVCC